MGALTIPNQWFDHGHPYKEVAQYLYDNGDAIGDEHIDQLVNRLSAIEPDHTRVPELEKKVKELEVEVDSLEDDVSDLEDENRILRSNAGEDEEDE